MGINPPNQEETSNVDDDAVLWSSRSMFHSDGTPKLYPGFTVLCHLRHQNPSQSDLRLSMIRNLPRLSSSNHVQLPPFSWHIELCGKKVCDPARWSDKDLSPQAARDRDLAAFRATFAAWKETIQKQLPVRVGFGEPFGTLGLFESKPLGLALHLSDPRYNESYLEEDYKMDRAKLLGFRKLLQGSMHYIFPLSAYYQIRSMKKNELEELQRRWLDGCRQIMEEVKLVEIDTIELCSFDTIFHYDVVDSVSKMDDAV